MSPSRRDFIRGACCAAAAFGTAASFERFSLLSALAQSPSNYKALVCIFLFGGNDSSNLVVPMADAGIPAGYRYSDYATIRGSLASGGSRPRSPPAWRMNSMRSGSTALTAARPRPRAARTGPKSVENSRLIASVPKARPAESNRRQRS